MIDKNTQIHVTAPVLDFNDKELIFRLQKALLLTLYENKKLSFNQYQCAVRLLNENSGNADFRQLF